MSTISLTNSMSAMSLGQDDYKSISANMTLSASAVTVVPETNIAVEKSQEEQIRTLAMRILDSNKWQDDPLLALLSAASISLENGLIMVGQGLQISVEKSKLLVVVHDKYENSRIQCIPKASDAEMAITIQSIVAKARETFDDKALAPVFDAELFKLALKGQDPTIVAFKKTFVNYISLKGIPTEPAIPSNTPSFLRKEFSHQARIEEEVMEKALEEYQNEMKSLPAK